MDQSCADYCPGIFKLTMIPRGKLQRWCSFSSTFRSESYFLVLPGVGAEMDIFYCWHLEVLYEIDKNRNHDKFQVMTYFLEQKKNESMAHKYGMELKKIRYPLSSHN